MSRATATESDSASALAWDDRWHVGLAAIDRMHEEFAVCVNALAAAPDGAAASALQALRHHLDAHFSMEERLMDEHCFPARGCHADEHARVLASVEEVQALVAGGDYAVARELAQALIEWFPGHSDHLDSAVAIWIVRRQTQGAPVVLRRSLAHTRERLPA